ncbi:SDR family oxidoreductase [Nocardia jejuensis]|uniref:SDR family oxidoreductase n=1 Tax=Nocardia jejuensis TaxID=328049 RepID=UPI00082F8B55|nr:NAD(P)H-binding protein [Nocardia jejuensis]
MYLVTGATGVIGRPLLHALRSDGAHVRALTRHPAHADLPDGVHAFAPDDIEAALEGVRGLFVHPRAVGEHTGKLVALAAERDVEKVVVLSAINVEEDPAHQPSRFNGDRNREVERAVTEGPLPWIAVRPSSFAMNTLGMWRGQLGFGDTVRGPFPGFAEAVIHERDVAEVIARALLGDDALLGRRIEVTGPEALRFDEMVPILGAVIGRPLRYQEVPAELATEAMIRNGLDENFAHALVARFERESTRPATVSTEVEAILGRPALTFAEWAGDHVVDWS